jgi:hypothetical protein
VCVCLFVCSYFSGNLNKNVLFTKTQKKNQSRRETLFIYAICDFVSLARVGRFLPVHSQNVGLQGRFWLATRVTTINGGGGAPVMCR